MFPSLLCISPRIEIILKIYIYCYISETYDTLSIHIFFVILATWICHCLSTLFQSRIDLQEISSKHQNIETINRNIILSFSIV